MFCRVWFFTSFLRQYHLQYQTFFRWYSMPVAASLSHISCILTRTGLLNLNISLTIFFSLLVFAIIYAFCFLSSLEESHMFFIGFNGITKKKLPFTRKRERTSAEIPCPFKCMQKYTCIETIFVCLPRTRINICTVLICFNRPFFFIISGFCTVNTFWSW